MRGIAFGQLAAAISLACWGCGEVPSSIGADPSKGTSVSAEPMSDLGVTCQLNAEVESRGVRLRVLLSNGGGREVRILKRQTPLEPDGSPSLRVQNAGASLSYRGKLAARLPPSDASYLSLPAGQAVTAEYDLSANYRLNMSGTYVVSLSRAVFDVQVGEGREAKQVAHGCGSTTFRLTEADPRADSAITRTTSPLLLFYGCAQNQKESIAIDVMNAKDAVRPGVVNQHVGPGDATFTKWFGAYTDFHSEVVSNRYALISNLLESDTMRFECSPSAECTIEYAAYVNGDCPANTACLCRPFFASSPLERMAIVIHEASHLKGTADYVYDEAPSMNLAITNPSAAINNADNYEYYSKDIFQGPVTAWKMSSNILSL